MSLIDFVQHQLKEFFISFAHDDLHDDIAEIERIKHLIERTQLECIEIRKENELQTKFVRNYKAYRHRKTNMAANYQEYLDSIRAIRDDIEQEKYTIAFSKTLALTESLILFCEEKSDNTDVAMTDSYMDVLNNAMSLNFHISDQLHQKTELEAYILISLNRLELAIYKRFN